MRTKNGLPKHCSWNLDRENGKRRVRFRKGGFSTYLNRTPWSEDFMRQYADALDGVKGAPNEIGAERTITGSIDALIISYYKLVFPTLKSSTRAVRRNILENFRAEHGKKPVARLEHQHVASIIAAKASAPHAANNLRKVLRHLMEHAIAINMATVNPVRGVQKFKTSGDGIHTWAEDEVAQFTARHPLGTKAHLAMMLMLCTGQRKSDAVRMGWQHVRDGKIAVRQDKTDEPLLIPIAEELANALALVPRTNMTFLLTARGAPFTKAGFGNWMRDRCDEAGLPQCSSHGLRKLTATRLANAGCSERQIMAITGHKSVSEVSRYTKAAEQARLAEQAMAKLRGKRTNEQETLSSMPTPLDKMTAK
jgi:integrase